MRRALMALIVAATTAFALCGGDIQPQRPGIIPELPAFSPTIRLWPAAARTFPRDRLAFHASGTDTRNAPALRWSLIGDGQISADGVYTAPSGAGGAQVIAAEGRVAAAAHIAVRAPPPPQRPLLIVSCYDDGALDVLDAKTLAQIGSFSAGRDAAGIAVDQRRRIALAATGDTVVAVNLTSMRFVASQPVPTARFSEVASLAGGYFAATDNNAVAGKPGIRLFRISAGTRPMLAAGVAAGETPEGIAVDHTGRQFVVSNINSNSIMRFFFDGHGHARLSGVAKTGARPYGIALDEAHGMLFVADNDTSTVSGAASRPGLEKFRLPSLRRVGTVEATGTSNALPLGVAEDSRSQQLFVTNEGDATVTVFSLPSIRRVATLRTGRLPWLPAVDEPDHRLYVPSAGEDVVQQFDTRGYVRAQSAEHVCGYPTAVALVAAAPSSRRTASPPRRSRIARRRG